MYQKCNLRRVILNIPGGELYITDLVIALRLAYIIQKCYTNIMKSYRANKSSKTEKHTVKCKKASCKLCTVCSHVFKNPHIIFMSSNAQFLKNISAYLQGCTFNNFIFPVVLSFIMQSMLNGVYNDGGIEFYLNKQTQSLSLDLNHVKTIFTERENKAQCTWIIHNGGIINDFVFLPLNFCIFSKFLL